MTDVLTFPEDHDGEKRTVKLTPSHEGVTTGQFATRVPVALSGTGEVQILWAGAEHTIVLKLPASVVEIVRQEIEGAGQIQNPADELARRYEAWDDCTSRRCTT